MGISRRTTTTRQHHSLTTHPLSNDDDDDDNDPINHSRSAASQRDSSLRGGVLCKVCIVILLTATAAIRSYSILLMSLSSFSTSARRSVVVDHDHAHLSFDAKHVTSPTPHFSGNDTLVVPKSTKEHDQQSAAAAATTTVMTTMIPRRLIFTHKSNLLEPGDEQRGVSMHEMRFHQNIMNTIEQYQLAWKAIDDAEKSNNIRTTTTTTTSSNKVQIWFLDNGDCEAAIQRVEPELVHHFREEKRGDYKADICRIAALYLHGGYYFDVDMRVIEPIIFERENHNVTFSTAIMQARDGFFQSFLASTASNEILQESLKIMLDWYNNKAVLRETETFLSEDEPSARDNVLSYSIEEGRRNSRIHEISNLHHGIDPALWVINRRGLIGPVSLKFAYERVLLLNSTSSFEASPLVTTGGNQRAFILQEDDLSANPNRELFPGLVRQEGDGCCCNYVVHGPPPSFISSSAGEQEGQNPQNTSATTRTPYFFSRIVGAGEYCHWKGGVGVWVRSQQQQKQPPTFALFKPF